MWARRTKAAPAGWAGAAYRPLMLGVTIVLTVAAAAVWATTYAAFAREGAVGIDKATHDAFAARWLATGTMYLDYQLVGPFNPQPLPHVPPIMPSMYPPTAVLLFAPFAVLPAVAWWVVPIGAVAWIVWRWKPAPWTWPLLALVLVYPGTSSSVWAGNTTMWFAAGVAAALRWGWAGPLLLLKPSLFVFALAGVWRRAWWYALAGSVALGVAMLGDWFRYLDVVRNAQTSLAYSLGSVPILLLPVIAWLGSRRLVHERQDDRVIRHPRPRHGVSDLEVGRR
jgi:hypothetical protein